MSMLDNLILQMNLDCAMKRGRLVGSTGKRYENSKRELSHNLSFNSSRNDQVPETYEKKDISISYVMNEI